MMKLYHIDAFTSRPFSGNPAAVCLLQQAAPDAWMQSLAAELNLSETAFCYPLEQGYNLRWFTPKVEVDLCGHATLATAHVLCEEGILSTGDTVQFHTRSGWLSAVINSAGITLDFPAIATVPAPCPEGLLKALGLAVRPLYSAKAGPDWFLVVEHVHQVQRLQPDFPALIPYSERGIVVTAQVMPEDKSGHEADFVSRCFGPAAGINEDPVTGSTHCALGPYWKERLNKNPLRAYQCSARGGGMLVEVVGERVKLTGRAVTVMCAQLRDTCLPIT